MSSAADSPITPRPSVFISYASEDRVAARALRDALLATGLEVWYDENELGGGDVWDQKIRRQIRDCDYFMPMISAATEKRKEGYFRREWRLASERTLDMADDVMFLLPVVIDGTSEAMARVPDKFLTVQWLKLPGGVATPALEALCRRLLAGDHTAPPRPAFTARATSHGTSAPPHLPPPKAGEHDAEGPHQGPPPMPVFPHPPKKGEGLGHGLKFLAEAVWWMVTASWVLFRRAPKWARVVIAIWFVFFIFSIKCSRDDSPPVRPTREKKPAAASTSADAEAMRNALKSATAEAKKDPNFNPEEMAKIGEDIIRRFAGVDLSKAQAGKSLTLVPFAQAFTDQATAKFANDIFSSVFGRLLTVYGNGVGFTNDHPSAYTDAALVAYGKKHRAGLVLSARPADDDPRALTLRLIHTEDGVVVWTATYSADPATLSEVSGKISEAALAALPKK